MQALFARNLEMFAELTEQLLVEDQIKAIKRMRPLRDQLNAGFDAVRSSPTPCSLSLALRAGAS